MSVLQVITLRLKAEAQPAVFAAANERIQREVTPHMKGLIRRESGHNAEGHWVIVNLWADLESAKLPPTANAEIVKSAMSHVDMTSMTAHFYPLQNP